MKIFRIAFMVVTVCFIATLASCSKDDDSSPSEAKKITGLLTAGAWKIQSVFVDDVAHDELFQDLKLTFTANGFTAVNGASVWPSNGTWQFTDNTASAFARGDGIEVRINEISDTRLVLMLTWTETTIGGGRLYSIGGDNEFTFTR
jgi:hypothetical protein